ncbi:MAG: hypothetical protein DMG65_17050 [Candidatus Angelobacter sp. Gp1-AA117]|nr:MAG: hypothetical protein DMG65_17050 [Candidatus Angelobacter sp. Gp1-AA117]
MNLFLHNRKQTNFLHSRQSTVFGEKFLDMFAGVPQYVGCTRAAPQFVALLWCTRALRIQILQEDFTMAAKKKAAKKTAKKKK